MKHIIIFEDYNIPESSIRYYWKVPTGDKLRIALLKIGTPDRFMKAMLSDNKKDYDYIYIGEYYDKDHWGWNPDEDVFTQGINSKYLRFAGTVEVDDSEISGDKYNL